MSSDAGPVVVADAPADRRYEARVGGELAAFVTYTIRGDLIRLLHTEVDPAFEGRGIGGALARGTLDDVRTRGLQVRPDCPFMRAWIGRHPDYGDMVA